MKKKIIFLIFIFIINIFCFLGCGQPNNFFSSIEFKFDEINVYKGYEYDLNDLSFESDPKCDSINSFDYSFDENYINFLNNKFIFKKIGKTELEVFALKNDNEVIKNKIKINILDDEFINEFDINKTFIHIDKNEKFNLNSFIEIQPKSLINNVKVFNNNLEILNKTDYSIDKVGEYDLIFKVLKSKKTNEVLIKKIKVVVDNNIYIENVGLEDNKIYNVYENSVGKIDFKIQPNNANVYEIISKNDNLKIDNNGKFEALNKFDNINVLIKYKSDKNSSLKEKLYVFNIVEKPKILDYNFSDLNENIVNKFVVGDLSDYSLNLKFNCKINVNNIEFSELFKLNNITTNQEFIRFNVKFKNKVGDYYLTYKFSDDFNNHYEYKYVFDNLTILNKNEIKLEFLGNNALLNYDNENMCYELFSINENYYNYENITYNYKFKINCFLNDSIIENSINQFNENFILLGDYWVSKKIGKFDFSYCVFGSFFNFKINVSNVKINDFEVELNRFELLLNSDQDELCYTLISNEIYSNNFKNLKIEFDCDPLNFEVDYVNKKIKLLKVVKSNVNIIFTCDGIVKKYLIKTDYFINDFKVFLDEKQLDENNLNIRTFYVNEPISYGFEFLSNNLTISNAELNCKIECWNLDSNKKVNIYYSMNSSDLNVLKFSSSGDFDLKFIYNDGQIIKSYKVKVL